MFLPIVIPITISKTVPNACCRVALESMLREDKSFGEIVRKSLLAMPEDQVKQHIVMGVRAWNGSVSLAVRRS